MAARGKAPATPPAADDFDESSPPPRQRPRGTSAPRHLALPPGEEAGPTFAAWDKQGRIPPGCALLEHVGSFRAKHSGYRVEAVAPGCRLGVAVGRVDDTPDRLDGWRIVGVLV